MPLEYCLLGDTPTRMSLRPVPRFRRLLDICASKTNEVTSVCRGFCSQNMSFHPHECWKMMENPMLSDQWFHSPLAVTYLIQEYRRSIGNASS